MNPHEFIMQFSNYLIVNMKLKRNERQNPPDLKAPQLERDVLVNLIGYFQHVIILYLRKERQKEPYYILV